MHLAKDALDQAGVAHTVRLRHGNCSSWQLPARPHLAICNPPWGQRLQAANNGRSATHQKAAAPRSGEQEGGRNIVSSWKDLRAFLKAQCQGSEAFVLCGNKEVSKHIGMRASRRFPVSLAGVDTRLLKYEVRADIAANSVKTVQAVKQMPTPWAEGLSAKEQASERSKGDALVAS